MDVPSRETESKEGALQWRPKVFLPHKDLQMSSPKTFLELSAISANEICRKLKAVAIAAYRQSFGTASRNRLRRKTNSHEKNCLNCPFVRTNTADPVHFTLTPPECSMELRTGYALNGPRVSGPVRVGDPLTLIINMRSNFGERKNCIELLNNEMVLHDDGFVT